MDVGKFFNFKELSDYEDWKGLKEENGTIIMIDLTKEAEKNSQREQTPVPCINKGRNVEYKRKKCK